jgi:hypothetical protein
MKILALEQESDGMTAERFAPYLKSEALRIWELNQTGFIREMYFRGDRTQAVLILESSDVTTASQILGTLPLVRDGLITFELIPLVAYPGFARLFA